jgi:cation transport ATPase
MNPLMIGFLNSHESFKDRAQLFSDQLWKVAVILYILLLFVLFAFLWLFVPLASMGRSLLSTVAILAQGKPSG